MGRVGPAGQVVIGGGGAWEGGECACVLCVCLLGWDPGRERGREREEVGQEGGDGWWIDEVAGWSAEVEGR